MKTTGRMPDGMNDLIIGALIAVTGLFAVFALLYKIGQVIY